MKDAIFILLFLGMMQNVYSQEHNQKVSDKRDPVANSSSLKGNAGFRKNSIYYGNFVINPRLSADRIIPITNHMGIVLGGGLYFYANTNYIANLGFIFEVGGLKHFIEFGVSYYTDRGYYKTFYEIGGNLGYRYVGNKGLMVKAGIDIVENVPVFPAIGIGYSF